MTRASFSFIILLHARHHSSFFFTVATICGSFFSFILFPRPSSSSLSFVFLLHISSSSFSFILILFPSSPSFSFIFLLHSSSSPFSFILWIILSFHSSFSWQLGIILHTAPFMYHIFLSFLSFMVYTIYGSSKVMLFIILWIIFPLHSSHSWYTPFLYRFPLMYTPSISLERKIANPNSQTFLV